MGGVGEEETGGKDEEAEKIDSVPMRRLPLLAILLVALFLAACDSQTEVSSIAAEPVSAPAMGDICPALISEEALSKPPAVPLTDPMIRILAFGDFGEQPNRNTEPQRRVAAAMAGYHAEHPFDFGLVLGDNFYPAGLDRPDHPRWASQWERLYSPLGIRHYAILGNHDYKSSASPAAQMERSRRSATWCLPRRQYTFTAGPVQLFAIDTTPVEEPRRDSGDAMADQLRWLDEALGASRSTWKVVYGHHPVYTTGDHGDRIGYLPRVRDYLLPVLRKHKVDVYLAGHDHDLQALEPQDGVHFFVSGAAGRHLRGFESSRCRRWGTAQTYGFTVLETDAAGLSLRVSFVGYDEDKPYRVLWGPVAVEKGASSGCRTGR